MIIKDEKHNLFGKVWEILTLTPTRFTSVLNFKEAWLSVSKIEKWIIKTIRMY